VIASSKVELHVEGDTKPELLHVDISPPSVRVVNQGDSIVLDCVVHGQFVAFDETFEIIQIYFFCSDICSPKAFQSAGINRLSFCTFEIFFLQFYLILLIWFSILRVDSYNLGLL
jgi:hypothetical protein